MKKIVTGATTALLAGVLIFGSPALAGATEGEEAPVQPEETTSAPIEEVPVPVEEEVLPTPEEVVPDTETTTEETITTPEEEPYVPEETDPTVENPIEQWRIMRWTLPDGGTPDNVTWPQPVFDADSIPCGTSVWIQVDQYPYLTDEDRIRTDALDDDGILEYGEDHGWAYGWTFEQFTAEDCIVIPEQPEAKVEYRESSSLDCTAELVTTVTEARRSDPVYVEETNSWVDGEWTDWTEVKSEARKATAEECPVVIPPVVEPPAEEPKVEAKPVAAAATTGQLAETGSNASDGLLWGFGGVMALLTGLTLVVTRRLVANK